MVRGKRRGIAIGLAMLCLVPTMTLQARADRAGRDAAVGAVLGYLYGRNLKSAAIGAAGGLGYNWLHKKQVEKRAEDRWGKQEPVFRYQSPPLRYLPSGSANRYPPSSSQDRALDWAATPPRGTYPNNRRY
jgi:hypothetical protein